MGQGVDDDPMPQQDQQQDRRIPGEFHVDISYPGNQPVIRQPHNTDGKAQDRCQKYADDCYQSGVQ